MSLRTDGSSDHPSPAPVRSPDDPRGLVDHPWTAGLQAAALVAAPLAGLATTLVWPQTSLDVGARLAELAGAPGRFQLGHGLNLLTILLFVPAVAGMHRLLQPRRPLTAAVGTGLVAAGLVGWSGVLALAIAELQLATTLSGSTAVSAAESLHGSPVAIVLTAMFLLCTFAGLVVLTMALWRARVVPGWVAAAVGLAVVGDMVGSTLTAVVVTVWLLLTLAFAAVALVRVGRSAAA